MGTGTRELYFELHRDGTRIQFKPDVFETIHRWKYNLILVKVTDDILFSGSTESMKQFAELIGERLQVSKEIIDRTVNLNGCTIQQKPNGDVTMIMDTYLQSLKYIPLYRALLKQSEEKITDEEYSHYRRLAGEILWAVNGCLPQASFVGSNLQQLAPRLRVCDLTSTNKTLAKLKNLSATIKFKKATSDIKLF